MIIASGISCGASETCIYVSIYLEVQKAGHGSSQHYESETGPPHEHFGRLTQSQRKIDVGCMKHWCCQRSHLARQ